VGARCQKSPRFGRDLVAHGSKVRRRTPVPWHLSTPPKGGQINVMACTIWQIRANVGAPASKPSSRLFGRLWTLCYLFACSMIMSFQFGSLTSFFHSTSQLNSKVLIEFERLDLRQRSWFSSAIFCELKRPTSIQKSDLNLDHASVTACAYISGKITVFQRNRIFPKILVSAYTLALAHQRKMALQIYKTCANMYFFPSSLHRFRLVNPQCTAVVPLGQ